MSTATVAAGLLGGIAIGGVTVWILQTWGIIPPFPIARPWTATAGTGSYSMSSFSPTDINTTRPGLAMHLPLNNGNYLVGTKYDPFY